MRNILILDDEVNVLHALERALRLHFPPADVRMELFTTPIEALSRCTEIEFDVVLSDFRMPLMSGVDFLRAIKELVPGTIRIMLSASTEFDTVANAVNEAEIFRYLSKPWEIADLTHNIALAFAHRDAILREQRLADEQRLRNGLITPQELEARRLEQAEPGIMKVNWGPDGEVIL